MKQKVLIEAADPKLIPTYGTPFSAGADVRAHIKKSIVVEPGTSLLVPTGLKMEIPEGFEIQVRPRSGLALKNQITILNTPGTIDSDYRGELGILLINHGKEPFTITPGMRIAQIILAPVMQAEFQHVQELLTHTVRGEGGFGHTGAN